MSGRRDLLVAFVVSVGSNLSGLGWGVAWLFLGALGVGMSSQPPDELEAAFIPFAVIALAGPAAVNALLAASCIVLRKREYTLGWLTGLGLVAIAAMSLTVLVVLMIRTAG